MSEGLRRGNPERGGEEQETLAGEETFPAGLRAPTARGDRDGLPRRRTSASRAFLGLGDQPRCRHRIR
jgi:hypothetical protein